MANKTVYPYGASGELPSSIGIINDLVTGGANKALSAEQGKVLNNTKVSNANSFNNVSLSVIDNSVSVFVSESELTLDSVAYENLTYRQIFETNNMVTFGAGFEDGGWGGYTISAGSPEVTTEEADSGSYSLKCSGTTSQQIRSPLTGSYTAWIASRIKVTSWTAGYCGMQYGVGGESSHDGAVSGVTDGWVTKVARKDGSSSYYIYIGSILSANLTGYVDTPVVIKDSLFTNIPSEEQFSALYNAYCSIKRGDTVDVSPREIKLCVDSGTATPDATECKSAFMAALNEKMKFIGATTANFLDASGLTWNGSSASAKDILQIIIHAAGIRGIAEKWGKKSYTVKIFGDNAREEIIATSVASATYDESAHPILGGKTGTITASGNVNYNLAWIARVNGVECACVLMGDSSDARRWTDAEAIADYLETVLGGGSATLSINAPRAAACKLPQTPIMYDGIPLDLLISKSVDTVGIPASLTKVASLILAYDYIVDENERVEIIASDIIGGSGDNLQAGDIVSVRDLIYDMLLPSSNDAATALARHVGAKML